MYINEAFGIFGEIYVLLDNFIFNYAIQNYLEGNLPNMTSAQFANMDLVCTLVATLLTLFVIGLPFIILFLVIKGLVGGK